MYLAFSYSSDTTINGFDFPIVYRLDEEGEIVWTYAFTDSLALRDITITDLTTLENGDVLGVGRGFGITFDDGEVEFL